jgi:hypothetical protein
MQEREIAYRIFAGEYNRSTVRISPEANRMPSYILTELGTKINRLFIVGVLTDAEQINEEKEIWRAHLSDPTGIFTLYSGLYQPDVSLIFKEVETPIYLAVVGKAHTFEPEEGKTFVSIRPEQVKVVNESIRNYWILETYKHTRRRLEGMEEALQMKEATQSALENLGYPKKLAQGIINAIQSYQKIDCEYYRGMLQDTLSYFSQQIEASKSQAPEKKPAEEPIKPEPLIKEEPNEKEKEAVEEKILEVIKELETDQGVQWNSIIERGGKEGINKYALEEALSSLMDKGLVYEPFLGWIKRA